MLPAFSSAESARLRRRPAVVLRASLTTNERHTIFCGASLHGADEKGDWYKDVDENRPGVVQILPGEIDLPSPRPQKRARTSGCGAPVHEAVILTGLQGQSRKWVSAGGREDGEQGCACAPTVILLDEMYHPRELREMPEMQRAGRGCGCGARGVGCAVCGNALGVVKMWCAEHRNSGREKRSYVFLASAVTATRSPSSTTNSPTSADTPPLAGLNQHPHADLQPRPQIASVAPISGDLVNPLVRTRRSGLIHNPADSIPDPGSPGADDAQELMWGLRLERLERLERQEQQQQLDRQTQRERQVSQQQIRDQLSRRSPTSETPTQYFPGTPNLPRFPPAAIPQSLPHPPESPPFLPAPGLSDVNLTERYYSVDSDDSSNGDGGHAAALPGALGGTDEEGRQMAAIEQRFEQLRRERRMRAAAGTPPSLEEMDEQGDIAIEFAEEMEEQGEVWEPLPARWGAIPMAPEVGYGGYEPPPAAVVGTPESEVSFPRDLTRAVGAGVGSTWGATGAVHIVFPNSPNPNAGTGAHGDGLANIFAPPSPIEPVSSTERGSPPPLPAPVRVAEAAEDAWARATEVGARHARPFRRRDDGSANARAGDNGIGRWATGLEDPWGGTSAAWDRAIGGGGTARARLEASHRSVGAGLLRVPGTETAPTPTDSVGADAAAATARPLASIAEVRRTIRDGEWEWDAPTWNLPPTRTPTNPAPASEAPGNPAPPAFAASSSMSNANAPWRLPVTTGPPEEQEETLAVIWLEQMRLRLAREGVRRRLGEPGSRAAPADSSARASVAAIEPSQEVVQERARELRELNAALQRAPDQETGRRMLADAIGVVAERQRSAITGGDAGSGVLRGVLDELRRAAAAGDASVGPARPDMAGMETPNTARRRALFDR